MSTSLLVRVVDKLDYWAEELTVLGTPASVSLGLSKRARLIESHLSKGATDHAAMLGDTADLVTGYSEYVDPQRIRREMIAVVSELVKSRNRKERSKKAEKVAT